MRNLKRRCNYLFFKTANATQTDKSPAETKPNASAVVGDDVAFADTVAFFMSLNAPQVERSVEADFLYGNNII